MKFKISFEKTAHAERELDIIDIVEREIELIEKVNFTILCKSDHTGNVFLPRLIITEEQTKKQIHFDKLLNFYCQPI